MKRFLSSNSPNLPRGPLRILDIAAGNGRVGAELRDRLGKDPRIERLIGTDLLETARWAALRDREPDPYDDFVVADLIDSSQPAVKQWKRTPFDVVTICAALGPGEGDLPLEVVDAAIGFLETDGLLVFTLNEGVQGGGGRYREFLCSLSQEGQTHWKEMKEVDRLVY